MESKHSELPVLNYQRDDKDPRDYELEFLSSRVLSKSGTTTTTTNPPSVIDWSAFFTYVYKQGTIGSCTACSVNSLISFVLRNKIQWIPSRLFTYYNSREFENNICVDHGSTLRNSIKSLVQKGVCNEDLWPYNQPFSTRPSTEAYESASLIKVVKYASIRCTVEQFEQALLNGFIIAFGIPIYSSFFTARNGDIPHPNIQHDRFMGYHAIVCVGYDSQQSRFKFRNSWGTEWGDQGYGTIPYSMLQFAVDAWTIIQCNHTNTLSKTSTILNHSNMILHIPQKS